MDFLHECVSPTVALIYQVIFSDVLSVIVLVAFFYRISWAVIGRSTKFHMLIET